MTDRIARIAGCLLFCLTTAVGACTVQRYGASYDELANHEYGEHSLNNYARAFSREGPVDYGKSYLDRKGPAFFMVAALAERLSRALVPGLPPLTGWHFASFMAFQASVLALYLLVRRWVRPWTAVAVCLLFWSQPLLWGHAFINPKDIPFMALFLLSVAVGARMLSDPASGSKGIARLVAAGALLGITTSLRPLGVLAGLIVATWALTTDRRVFGRLAGYGFIAAVVTLAAWPFTWPEPVGRMLDSVRLMSAYDWHELVLFAGVYYDPGQQPWYAIPQLMFMQLTEPLVLAAVAGLVVAIRGARLARIDWIVLSVWSIVPVAAAVFRHATIYDNFRHFFFVLPPLFVLAAIGIDGLMTRLRTWQGVALLVALAAPGLAAIYRLHPYEYTYYNTISGGSDSTFRRYEADYWATSYREAAEILNREASVNARVLANGPSNLLALYVRSDIRVMNPGEELVPEGEAFDYVVSLTRWDLDLKACPDADVVATIGRGEAVFAVIRRLDHRTWTCVQ